MIDASLKPPAPIHLNYLDGVRGIAAVYVMLHHSWLTVWPDPVNFPRGLTGYLTTWLEFGHLAVAVFIVLSGFCLMLPVVRGGGELRGGPRRFFRRRARRILPPYYFAMLLAIVLSLTVIGGDYDGFWGIALPHGKKAWLKSISTHALLVEDFFDTYKINYVFWSVAVEWQIYFLFPMLVLLYRRRGHIVTAAIGLLVSFAIALALNGHHRFQLVHIDYVGLFTLGMFGAAVAFRGKLPSRTPWRLLGVLAAAATIALGLAGGDAFDRHMLLSDFLVGLATTSLLIVASTPGHDPVRSFFASKPVAWIGTFSYSLYLIHAPFLGLFWKFVLVPSHLSSPAMFSLLVFVGGPLIIIASYLFYLVCERPFLNLQSRSAN